MPRRPPAPLRRRRRRRARAAGAVEARPGRRPARARPRAGVLRATDRPGRSAASPASRQPRRAPARRAPAAPRLRQRRQTATLSPPRTRRRPRRRLQRRRPRRQSRRARPPRPPQQAPPTPSSLSGWTIQTPSAMCSARTLAGTSASSRWGGRGSSPGTSPSAISQSAVEAPACGCPSRSQLQASSAAGPAQRTAVLAIGGLSQRLAAQFGVEIVPPPDDGHRHPTGLQANQRRLRDRV